MLRRALLQSLVSAAAVAPAFASRGEESGAGGRAVGAPRVGARRKEPFVEAPDGTRLHFKDWGAGPTVLFAAPWSLHSNWWEYQMASLPGEGLRCIAYDRRGHGRSGEPGEGYEFDTLAGDLAALIDQLDLRDITLVGHSMGAGEVVRYLSRFGSARRVARAVLVAPITPFTLKTADNPDGVERTSLEKARLGLSKDRPGVLAAAAAGFFGAPKNPVSARTMEWWTEMILSGCSLRVMLDLHRVFTETDFRPDLHAVTVPTLIVHGDADTSAPLDFTGRRTAALIRGSQLKVYEGAAHGLPVTHMDRLNADLLTFVRS